ncbi:MAG: hypothetical protein PVF73_10125, partial [Bacteroidales bacterium]
MKSSRKIVFIAGSAALIILLILFAVVREGKAPMGQITGINRPPVIFPDYAQVTIPPNIAPLNFTIKEKGQKYYLKIYGSQGDTIRISGSNSTMMIPVRKWKELLEKNAGWDVYFDIYVDRGKGQWHKFNSIINHIANEEIDSYLVYRLINPGYILWDKMGIYSRNIENFKETPIIVNEMADRNCMNCHSFCQNNANEMIFHIRGSRGGTVLWKDGMLKKINTATGYTMSAGVYPAWHPNGRLIAFSVNMIRQRFNTSNEEPIEVYDGYSDIILYDIDANEVTTSPKLSTKKRENMPEWSPNGEYLYFCTGPELSETERHSSISYDLQRISYSAGSGEWGDVEPILNLKEENKSISWPKISPDGKYLLFCLSKHGYFTIHYHSSDLYMLDLSTGTYRRLELNSESVESYHSWSKNSRWFVYSSKKDDGLCSRPYFCYIDTSGKTGKPFILPQKDPEFYATFLKNYNVPEMVSDKVELNKNKLLNV